MLSCMLVLLLMPVLDTARVRSGQFRPMYRALFWLFVADFVLLTWLGINHAEEPYTTIGVVASVYYFTHYLVLLPLSGMVSNTLADMGTGSTTGH